MKTNSGHMHHAAAAAPAGSPRLIRSRSGSPAISLPDSRFVFLNRSKSTAKPTSSCRTDDQKQKFNLINTQRKVAFHDDSAKFVQRTQSKIEVPRRARSASTSPSAWALSPGRLIPPPLPMAPAPVQAPQVPKPRSPICTGKLCSGVLKYFRQKKVSPLQEEEHHQFRVRHNRLLQWRFANARAEVSMAAARRNAEKKLVNVWARITMLRKLVMEKRIQMQTIKQEIEVYRLVGLQIHLLKEWGRLETKNFEAVGRLARKLSAISICLPLVQDAKAEITTLDEAMCMGLRVMESIEESISPIQWQVEKTCYLLMELSIVLKEQTEEMNKLAKLLAKLVYLEAAESSLKVHCMQLS